MARASVSTWLPLDEWAIIMGYNRWHFNGIELSGCESSPSCGSFWFQYPEQTTFTTREELALAIRQAEDSISAYVGYNLLPDWREESLSPSPYYDRNYTSPVMASGYPKSIELKRGHVLAGGFRAVEEVSLGEALVYNDFDNDGTDETAEIVIDLSDYDLNEIRVFYPGETGDETWEIRPIKVQSDRIRIPMWLIVKPELIGPTCQDSVDGDNPDNYLDTVDIYRVYNDTTTQVTLLWEENCACGENDVCTHRAYDNCLRVRDSELGYVVYNPNLYREPSALYIRYYSGWRGKVQRPLVELDPIWKPVIAYYAAGLLQNVCACCDDNLPGYVNQWSEDISRISKEVAYRATTRQMENIFGISTKGAWYAYNMCRLRKL